MQRDRQREREREREVLQVCTNNEREAHLTLFFPMFTFDPPQNIEKLLVL